MKKPTKTSLTKKLDKAWSDVIRSLGRCERCYKTEGLQAAHIITRSNRALRWDLDNGLCLCSGCHLFWAHKEPLEFAEFVQNRYPTRYEKIMKVKNELVHWTIPDMQERLEQLKLEL